MTTDQNRCLQYGNQKNGSGVLARPDIGERERRNISQQSCATDDVASVTTSPRGLNMAVRKNERSFKKKPRLNLVKSCWDGRLEKNPESGTDEVKSRPKWLTDGSKPALSILSWCSCSGRWKKSSPCRCSGHGWCPSVAFLQMFIGQGCYSSHLWQTKTYIHT